MHHQSWFGSILLEMDSLQGSLSLSAVAKRNDHEQIGLSTSWAQGRLKSGSGTKKGFGFSMEVPMSSCPVKLWERYGVLAFMNREGGMNELGHIQPAPTSTPST